MSFAQAQIIKYSAQISNLLMERDILHLKAKKSQSDADLERAMKVTKQINKLQDKIDALATSV